MRNFKSFLARFIYIVSKKSPQKPIHQKRPKSLAKNICISILIILYKAMLIIDKTARFFVIFLIRGLRPLLGPAHCRYPISCTDYAENTLRTRSFFPAVWLVTKRVLSCNPFMKPRLEE